MRRALRQVWADFRAALGIGSAPVPATPPASPFGSEETALGPEGGITAPAPAAEARPTSPFWSRPAVLAAVAALVGLAAWPYLRPLLLEPEPADAAVVATYTDGVVTKEELAAELARHSAAEHPAVASPAGLRLLVQDLAVHRVAERWARERRLDERSSVRHALRHVAEDVTLADLGRQVHEGRIRVDESEVQRQYDDNRARFGDMTLEQARPGIRDSLHAEREHAYIDEYLRSLRQSASVTIDDGLLAEVTPTEAEVAAYYAARAGEFREPDGRRVQEVRFPAGERGAKEQAERARARVVAGEELGAVAGEPAGTWSAEAAWVARGSRSEAFEAAVWPLGDGELSPVFGDGADLRLVRVVGRRPERQRPLDEVRADIVGRLAAEQRARQDELNRDRTLFTIRGRRVTLGEVLDDLDELAPELRARYAAADARRALVDRLIDRLLLLDDASGQLLEVKSKREIEDARRHLLAEALHQEEVQDKLTASDEEVRSHYDAHRDAYVEPARVKISYVRVRAGGTPDERRAAQAKIGDAERRLGEGGGGEEAFAAVAKEFSEDAATAATGGFLDRWLVRSDDALTHALSHAFVETVFRLAPGQVSPAFLSGGSYYLVRVRERTEERPLGFEQAREAVRRDVLDAKHLRALETMGDELSRRMDLRIYDGRLRQVLDEAGAARAG